MALAVNTNTLETYGYGTLAVFLISLLSLLGVVVVPFLSKTYYSYLILGLIALAIGTMSGDAFLHLIPQALGLHEHSHSTPMVDAHAGHDHGDHDHQVDLNPLATQNLSRFLSTTTLPAGFINQTNHDDSHEHATRLGSENDAVWKLLVVLGTIFLFHLMELLLRYLQEVVDGIRRRRAGLPPLKHDGPIDTVAGAPNQSSHSHGGGHIHGHHHHGHSHGHSHGGGGHNHSHLFIPIIPFTNNAKTFNLNKPAIKFKKSPKILTNHNNNNKNGKKMPKSEAPMPNGFSDDEKMSEDNNNDTVKFLPPQSRHLDMSTDSPTFPVIQGEWPRVDSDISQNDSTLSKANEAQTTKSSAFSGMLENTLGNGAKHRENSGAESYKNINNATTSGFSEIRLCPNSQSSENQFELARHDNHVDFLVRRRFDHPTNVSNHVDIPMESDLTTKSITALAASNNDNTTGSVQNTASREFVAPLTDSQQNYQDGKLSQRELEQEASQDDSHDSVPVLLRVCLKRSSTTNYPLPPSSQPTFTTRQQPKFLPNGGRAVDGHFESCKSQRGVDRTAGMDQTHSRSSPNCHDVCDSNSSCSDENNTDDAADRTLSAVQQSKLKEPPRMEHRHHELRHDHSTCHHRDIMKAADVINSKKRELAGIQQSNAITASATIGYDPLDNLPDGEDVVDNNTVLGLKAYDNKLMLQQQNTEDNYVINSLGQHQQPKVTINTAERTNRLPAPPSYDEASSAISIIERPTKKTLNGDHGESGNEEALSSGKNSQDVLKRTKDKEQLTIVFKGGSGSNLLPICGLQSLSIFLILGDVIHNIIDGIAIGAAFSSSVREGMSTSFAVFCHELPHELGDFAVLVSTGMSFRAALLVNLFAALTSFFGLYLSLSISNNSIEVRRWIFALTAGMFLYVALVDMLPELREIKVGSQAWSLFCQNVGILAGVGIMLVVGLYEHLLF